MAITSLDGLVAALSTAQNKPWYKTFAGTLTAGAFQSSWLMAGDPGAGASPSGGLNGEIPTDATAGAIVFSNAASGSLYLVHNAVSANQSGTVYVYDRLWQNTVTVTSTSAQNITQPSLTRPDALGNDVELWWQTYATMGSGTPTWTATYTDQDGNTGNSASSGVLTTTMISGRTGPFTLASGDTGVRSVQTIQLSATMTSGTAGLVLRKRIATISVSATATGCVMDAFDLGMPTIPSDTCFEFLWLPAGTVSPTIFGTLILAEG